MLAVGVPCGGAAGGRQVLGNLGDGRTLCAGSSASGNGGWGGGGEVPGTGAAATPQGKPRGCGARRRCHFDLTSEAC